MSTTESPVRSKLQNRAPTPVRNLLICVLMLEAIVATVHAFELTPAQRLVYDTPHLSNTVDGQRISYRYRSLEHGNDVVNDRVSLSISEGREKGRRNVIVEFLSAERRMVLPEFTDYRGNPVIIAMLEHIAQAFGKETGGGVLYFRNRIRDALAQDNLEIERLNMEYDGKTVAARRVNFLPFAGDRYLGGQPEFTGAVFMIVVSEQVPGGVIAVGVKSVQDGVVFFEREITIE